MTEAIDRQRFTAERRTEHGVQDYPVIVRRSLHEEVVERLRDLIFQGMLRSGEKIRNCNLCERFSVSRTPLREALKALAATIRNACQCAA